MLGLRCDRNLLVDSCPDWPLLFEGERQRIETALGDLPRHIEHYGSTAVPGLKAKPILDILLGIPRLGDWPAYRPCLEALGYDYAD